jgi:hypothetical protein
VILPRDRACSEVFLAVVWMRNFTFSNAVLFGTGNDSVLMPGRLRTHAFDSTPPACFAAD